MVDTTPSAPASGSTSISMTKLIQLPALVLEIWSFVPQDMSPECFYLPLAKGGTWLLEIEMKVETNI